MKIYSQSHVSVHVDGKHIKGLADGSSITVTPRGGEVDVVEGTDGPGINQATNQGGTIKIRLKENSPSLDFLNRLRKAQEDGYGEEEGIQVVIRSGVNVFHTLSHSLISRAGELATGDKKMGSREWSFAGTHLEDDNL